MLKVSPRLADTPAMQFQCIKCPDIYLELGDDKVTVRGICPACTRAAIGFAARRAGTIAADLEILIEKIDKQRNAKDAETTTETPQAAGSTADNQVDT